MGRVVGIDLGTTNSVVAVMEGGKPVVIANAEGMRTTPSVVAFSKEGEQLVGQMARRQSVLNPQNTFFGVKRFIGRRYNELNPDSKRVPYTIRKDENGNVKLKCPRLEKDFAPEEISAMVLRKLADEATRYLGQTVTGAVITVPAYFNDAQRQSTRNAGRIAGLDVLRILNEPTAASLAYGLDRRRNETILVFDLGGGTFDVSLMEVGDGVFEVKSTSGDTQLGGVDFDKRIVDWLANEFQEKEGIDLRRDRQALQRLIEAAEKAKIELSGVTMTQINLPFITATPEDGPKHIETRLTRTQFEEMCGDLLARLRGPVRQALRDAGLTPDDIDEVVLVGGSTRMPMVKELVRSLIPMEPNENVNPDEVVAVGAAIQAGILTQEVSDILLLDVTPLSLGLETIGGVMKKLIPRNTTIPVRRSDVFSTSENNQTMVEVHVVQGEREMAEDNKSLGRFKLMGIPPAPRGVPQISVSFDIDANGILQVAAVDRTTGREQGITVQGASTLSEVEVQRMIKEAEQFAGQDRERRERVEKRTKAEALTYQAERQLREVALDFGMQFASGYRRRIENLIQELRDALSKNDERRIDITEADLRDALTELQREVYDFNREEEEEEGFFSSIKRAILGDDDDDYPFERRDSWDDRSWDRGGRGGLSSYPDRWDSRESWDRGGSGRASYGREDRWEGDRFDENRRDANRGDDNRWDSNRRDDRPLRESGRETWSDNPRSDGLDRPAARDNRREDRESWSSERSRSRNRDSWNNNSWDNSRDSNARDSNSRDSNARDSNARDSNARSLPPRDSNSWENGTRRDPWDERSRSGDASARNDLPREGRTDRRDSESLPEAGGDRRPPRNRDEDFWDDRSAEGTGRTERPNPPPRSQPRRPSYDDSRAPRSRGDWDDEDDWL